MLTSMACDSQQQFAELLRRPSSEDAQRTYSQALTGVQAKPADVGLKDWKVGQDAPA